MGSSQGHGRHRRRAQRPLSEHQLFFANGGLGILAGDGSLDYAPEGIIEAYYACAVIDPVGLTLDYQFVANPAFNQERGPVHVMAVRAHVQF